MAESASTGNSGSTSTSGTAGNSGSTSTTSTTSTSTSTSGPAAGGSQTSSNGSFSTGKGSGNSGRLPGLGGQSWSSYTNSKGSETNAAHSSGTYGPGLSNGNFGSEWGGGGKHYISPDANGKHSISPDANGKHTVKSDGGDGKGNYTMGSQQYMTVDEVYGKGNQPMVESQGDYEASSNEKSNVETSTFGKQDEISVTPVSVTKDEGLVNDDAIQSVEGLDFQQKDKANQEVMEAKKSRDEAEAEDNADGMRDQLKAVAEKDAEETDAFQVGDRDEDVAAAKEHLMALKQEKEEAGKKYITDLKAAEKEQSDAELELSDAETKAAEARDVAASLKLSVEEMKDMSFFQKALFRDSDIESLNSNIQEMAEAYGIDAPEVKDVDSYVAAVDKIVPLILSKLDSRVAEAKNKFKESKQKVDGIRNAHFANIRNLNRELSEAQKTYDNLVSETFVENPAVEAKAEEEVAVKTETPTTEAPAYKGIINATKDEINNSKDLTDEQKAESLGVLDSVEAATDAVNKAANDLAKNPNDINMAQKYVKETARYNKVLNRAKGDKTLKNTDFNKAFVRTVAAANDFDVTREDGTVQSYAEFAAEMAVKSPALAKGLYEAKARNYEKNGHKVLAKIETAKSKMVMTWLGSKFTFADNQVRNQFNQMAKTDMRATYAANNNVLNDPNATPEQKAEAFKAIQQANSLMTASAALQASTGFLSGIGDGTSDGVYGVTNPDDLNGYQEALNTASNFAKITLGLGVTPGANEAYQNMYYMAGAKVNESGLFSKDFDGDGFALCQEYGNNAAVGMIAGAGELAAAVALTFNPATSKLGLNLAIDAVQTFLDGLYGVQKEVNKSIKYSNEVLSYFNEAKDIVAETGNEEIINTMDSAVKQIEDFQLKSDEVGNLDNWLEGSGSNTVDNGKFNQALSYDEWLKLIEADPVMQEYAKSLNR